MPGGQRPRLPALGILPFDLLLFTHVAQELANLADEASAPRSFSYLEGNPWQGTPPPEWRMYREHLQMVASSARSFSRVKAIILGASGVPFSTPFFQSALSLFLSSGSNMELLQVGKSSVLQRLLEVGNQKADGRSPSGLVVKDLLLERCGILLLVLTSILCWLARNLVFRVLSYLPSLP